MATREDLEGWLTEALALAGGSGAIVDLRKKIWELHESDLPTQATFSILGNTRCDGPRIDFVVEGL